MNKKKPLVIQVFKDENNIQHSYRIDAKFSMKIMRGLVLGWSKTIPSQKTLLIAYQKGTPE